MYLEDLAGLEHINEDNIVQQLDARFKKDQCYTFVGDVLLFLNPNQTLDIYGYQVSQANPIENIHECQSHKITF